MLRPARGFLRSETPMTAFRKKYSQGERTRAVKVVAECDGNLTKAARRLGISIPTLSRWYRVARLEATVSRDLGAIQS
jgi:transposase-like protein